MERVYSEGDEIMIIDCQAFVAENMDTDGTLTANSNLKVATQKATKTYVDTETGEVADSVASEALKYSVIFNG